ncbi:Hypothetical protein BRZCDTV_361 [Brazilian cedratvirus IHUMI]|uniref:Uncharacterized protein n=1 Tax=Brazilian cedratvirus IHUMI TaxID=2126980 RepID=A0A2R8FEP1_9VIRU|nr:Hypothetical protein BRZCDTV_361 [Brazilian cedratvirus IHUMI]
MTAFASQQLAAYEFFMGCDHSPELPCLPPEIKVHIYKYVCTCNHGCSNGKKLCCFCSDKRPVEEVYIYKDGKGLKKTKQRWTYYCPVCKKLGQRGKGPK